MNSTIVATLQNAQAGAANGGTDDWSAYDRGAFLVFGTYTGITANFEISYDAGVTYTALSVLNSAGTAVTTATANGVYRLPSDTPGGLVRARTTVAAPTGSMTVQSLKRENG